MTKELSQEEIEFLSEVLDDSCWLFYGELDELLPDFLEDVFSHELKDHGFGDSKMEEHFYLPYWLVLSEMVRLDLAEYGTSPRGAWLTEKGKKFKEILTKYPNAIELANDYLRH